VEVPVNEDEAQTKGDSDSAEKSETEVDGEQSVKE
jgi:hypothetical protein